MRTKGSFFSAWPDGSGQNFHPDPTYELLFPCQPQPETTPGSQLQNRILFHVSHKLGDETKLMIYHQKLGSAIEDQLSLASMHFMRGNNQKKDFLRANKSLFSPHTHTRARARTHTHTHTQTHTIREHTHN